MRESDRFLSFFKENSDENSIKMAMVKPDCDID